MSMLTPLRDLVERTARNQDLGTYNEDQTKQSILLPILQMLGWSIFDPTEVHPEYSAGKGRVDYALRVGGVNKVFVEAKRCSVDLEAHQEQLLRYAFEHGVPLAVLTNGTVWWFYLPLREGAWEQRKFYSLDLVERDPTDAADRLRDFLAREPVVAGKAVVRAEEVLTSRKRRAAVERTLPEAWDDLLSEQDETLVGLLRERVEQRCGHSPTDEEVGHYLAGVPAGRRVSLRGAKSPTPPPAARAPARSKAGGASLPLRTPTSGGTQEATSLRDLVGRDLRGTKPRALVAGNERIDARSWSQASVALVSWLARTGSLTRDALPVRTFAGKDRYLVNDSPAHGKESLGGSWTNVGSFYVDTNFSAKDHIRNMVSLLTHLGRDASDVLMELRAKPQ